MMKTYPIAFGSNDHMIVVDPDRSEDFVVSIGDFYTSFCDVAAVARLGN